MKIRREINEDPFYKTCIHARREESSQCSGRITIEHAFLYGGRQINSKFALVPCCWKHNVGVIGREKLWNQYVALLRATPEELAKYPKKDWQKEFQALRNEFEDKVPHCLLPF